MDKYEKKRREDEDFDNNARLFGHVYTYVSNGGHSDSFFCSCGWKSEPYWDGAEYALNDWREHVKKSIAEGQTHLDWRTP